MSRLHITLAPIAIALLCIGCQFHLAPQQDPFYSALNAAQPDNEFSQFARGRNSINQGQFTDARDLFKQYTKAYPQRASGWAALGQCELELRNYTRAQNAYLRAQELAPTMAGEVGLISALIFQGNAGAARLRLDAATEKYGENSVFSRLKGDLELLSCNYDKATEYYRKSLTQNPGQPDLQRRLEDLAIFEYPTP